MPLYVTEADVRATLTMRDALDLLDGAAREVAAGQAMNAPRQRVRSGGAILHVLPAALNGRIGHKTYTVGPSGATFWVTLFGPDGSMLAVIEANALGQIRTGAASGIATRYLARTDARTLVVIGTGFQARSQIEALCFVRPLATISVWGRDPERLATFCKEVSRLVNQAVEPATNLRDAIETADIVTTMTSSRNPVFDGAWLRPGTHVNAAGSNRANAQEIDVETVRRASIVAVEDVAQARIESGDLLAAWSNGAFNWEDAVRLADIIAGRATGRRNDAQITLFESLGIGLWDIAAANHVYDACLRERRGRELAM